MYSILENYKIKINFKIKKINYYINLIIYYLKYLKYLN